MNEHDPDRSPQAGKGDQPGEGFASSRPGNEYGAGAEGYAGAGASGGYGAGFGQGGAYGSARDGMSGMGGAGRMGGGSRLLDDLARLVTDAAGAAQGVRREMETAVSAQAESVLGRLDVVRRDEFEIVREMVSRMRAENDALRARVDALEARLGSNEGGQDPMGG